MRAVGLLVCVLFFGAGCASDDAKQQWANFKNEMSDDISMKPAFTQTQALDPASAPAKPGN
jgi:hypothetical protein